MSEESHTCPDINCKESLVRFACRCFHAPPQYKCAKYHHWLYCEPHDAYIPWTIESPHKYVFPLWKEEKCCCEMKKDVHQAKRADKKRLRTGTDRVPYLTRAYIKRLKE